MSPTTMAMIAGAVVLTVAVGLFWAIASLCAVGVAAWLVGGRLGEWWDARLADHRELQRALLDEDLDGPEYWG